MSNKIMVIGDSFAMAPNPNDLIGYDKDDYFWVDVLKKNYPESKFFIDGVPSRDVQTMVDNWIKLIPTINPEDFLIVGFPYMGRTRLPAKLGQGMYTDDNEFVYFDRFIGTRQFNNKYNELEFWGKDYDMDYFVKLMEGQEIINMSNAAHYNFIEIVESLVKITPCKTYLFSWDYMKIKSNLIEDRQDITNNIGHWESITDEYYNTGGKRGSIGNLHWSFGYNKFFGEYVLTKMK
jgi:hypothetical protein